MNSTNLKFFTGTELKLIALLTMTMDHFAAVLLTPGSSLYVLLRAIGRLAFPLYCFLLAEGFYYTKDHKAYLKRLFLFALISEIPFDFALFGTNSIRDIPTLMSHQNVFFTLFTGFLLLYLNERMSTLSSIDKSLMFLLIFALIAEALRFDYGLFGILMIYLFYAAKKNERRLPPFLLWFIALFPLLLSGQTNGLMILLDLPLIALYNGQKGKMLPGMKYLFYAYYPLHLFIFAIIAIFTSF